MEKYLLTEKSCENCSGVHVGAWVVSASVPSPYKSLVLLNMKWKTSGDQYMDGLICETAHYRAGCEICIIHILGSLCFNFTGTNMSSESAAYVSFCSSLT